MMVWTKMCACKVTCGASLCLWDFVLRSVPLLPVYTWKRQWKSNNNSHDVFMSIQGRVSWLTFFFLLSKQVVYSYWNIKGLDPECKTRTYDRSKIKQRTGKVWKELWNSISGRQYWARARSQSTCCVRRPPAQQRAPPPGAPRAGPGGSTAGLLWSETATTPAEKNSHVG